MNKFVVAADDLLAGHVADLESLAYAYRNAPCILFTVLPIAMCQLVECSVVFEVQTYKYKYLYGNVKYIIECTNAFWCVRAEPDWTSSSPRHQYNQSFKKTPIYRLTEITKLKGFLSLKWASMCLFLVHKQMRDLFGWFDFWVGLMRLVLSLPYWRRCPISWDACTVASGVCCCTCSSGTRINGGSLTTANWPPVINVCWL